MPVKFGWNWASSLTCESWTRFFIFSSGGHVVQLSGKCLWHAQLGLVLITTVKFGWHWASSLTCESRASWLWMDRQPDERTDGYYIIKKQLFYIYMYIFLDGLNVYKSNLSKPHSTDVTSISCCSMTTSNCSSKESAKSLYSKSTINSMAWWWRDMTGTSTRKIITYWIKNRENGCQETANQSCGTKAHWSKLTWN